MGFADMVVSDWMVSVDIAEVVGLADVVCDDCICCWDWLTIRTMWIAAKEQLALTKQAFVKKAKEMSVAREFLVVVRVYQVLQIHQRVRLRISATHLPQG